MRSLLAATWTRHTSSRSSGRTLRTTGPPLTSASYGARRRSVPGLLVDDTGEPGYRAHGENAREIDVRAEASLEATGDEHGGYGISAQLQEVAVHAHAIDSQHLGPERGDGGLRVRPRCDI